MLAFQGVAAVSDGKFRVIASLIPFISEFPAFAASKTMSNLPGRPMRCARKPTPRHSFPKREAEFATRSAFAKAAKCAANALNMRSRMMSDLTFGEDSQSASVASFAAKRSSSARPRAITEDHTRSRDALRRDEVDKLTKIN